MVIFVSQIWQRFLVHSHSPLFCLWIWCLGHFSWENHSCGNLTGFCLLSLDSWTTNEVTVICHHDLCYFYEVNQSNFLEPNMSKETCFSLILLSFDSSFGSRSSEEPAAFCKFRVCTLLSDFLIEVDLVGGQSSLFLIKAMPLVSVVDQSSKKQNCMPALCFKLMMTNITLHLLWLPYLSILSQSCLCLPQWYIPEWRRVS